MLDKVITCDTAIGKIKPGMTIMVGGFLGVGSPLKLLDALGKSVNLELNLIANDTSFPEIGVGKLIVNKQFKSVIVSHIGTNPETGKQMMDGRLKVELVPQGTLAERIRAGGSGLGGVLTQTGLGTIVEDGKPKITINSKEYLLETPLRADVALLYAHKADKAGNLVFRRSARNFNPVMALAADYVIAEVWEIVENGEIDPDEVVVPGVLIDALVLAKGGQG